MKVRGKSEGKIEGKMKVRGKSEGKLEAEIVK